MKKNRNPISFKLTTEIVFGHGTLNQAGNRAVGLGIKKALIVTDKGVKNLPAFEVLQKSLRDAGIECFVFDKVRPNPRDVDAQEAGDWAAGVNADGVVALGGGSSMDMGKATAALITNPMGIKRLMKPGKPKKRCAPLICIPTTAGTGSEVTSFAVLTLEEESRKSSIFDENIRPNVAICDPDMLTEVPPLTAAATGMDALTHAVEAYTCRLATPITDALALQAIRYISSNILDMVHNRKEDTKYHMMMGSLLAGLAFGYSDIAGVHCLAEAMGGVYDTPHGIANSIFLPEVFEYNISADPKRHKEVAEAMGVDYRGKTAEEAACTAVALLRDMSEKCGIPKLNQLEYVREEDFVKMADLCMKNVSLKSNAREITREDFENLYKRAYAR